MEKANAMRTTQNKAEMAGMPSKFEEQPCALLVSAMAKLGADKKTPHNYAGEVKPLSRERLKRLRRSLCVVPSGLPSTDSPQFRAFAVIFSAACSPTDELESALVERMIYPAWRVWRLSRFKCKKFEPRVSYKQGRKKSEDEEPPILIEIRRDDETGEILERLDQNGIYEFRAFEGDRVWLLRLRSEDPRGYKAAAFLKKFPAGIA